VVAPEGEIVAGPLRNEQGIPFADVDNRRTAIAKGALDIVGHYARPNNAKLTSAANSP
jgi:nitrilase